MYLKKNPRNCLPLPTKPNATIVSPTKTLRLLLAKQSCRAQTSSYIVLVLLQKYNSHVDTKKSPLLQNKDSHDDTRILRWLPDLN